MVLESIVSGKELMKHPLVMLFIAILFSSCGMWLAFFTFPNSSSILGIAFVTIALVPVMHNIFVKEEAIEAETGGWTPNFIERHFTVVRIYAWFFIGLIVSYAFWYAVLPIEMRETVFSEQEKVLGGIEELRDKMTGNFTIDRGACGRNAQCWFDIVFFNNAFVMLLSVVFSFIYGAGAVFLIGWNASVIGVKIGQEIVLSIAVSGDLSQGIMVGALNMIGLLPHGIPEALGYFFGAIAGGMIGVAVSKKSYLPHELRTISKDAIITLLIALAFLFVGGWIEAILIATA